MKPHFSLVFTVSAKTCKIWMNEWRRRLGEQHNITKHFNDLLNLFRSRAQFLHLILHISANFTYLRKWLLWDTGGCRRLFAFRHIAYVTLALYSLWTGMHLNPFPLIIFHCGKLVSLERQLVCVHFRWDTAIMIICTWRVLQIIF